DLVEVVFLKTVGTDSAVRLDKRVDVALDVIKVGALARVLPELLDALEHDSPFVGPLGRQNWVLAHDRIGHSDWPGLVLGHWLTSLFPKQKRGSDARKLHLIMRFVLLVTCIITRNSRADSPSSFCLSKSRIPRPSRTSTYCCGN